MICTRENISNQLAGHDVAQPMVCLHAGPTAVVLHVIVAKARFIEEGAP